MNLGIGQIQDALSGFVLVFHDRTSIEGRSFSGVETYMGQPTEPDIIYIVDGMMPNDVQGLFTIYAGTDANDGACRCTLQVEDSTAVQVANALAHYMAHLNECLETMRWRYYAEHDLQGFCQVIADFVGNPVVAYDATLLPAAQTPFPHDVAMRLFGAEVMDYDFVLHTIPDWKRQEGEDVLAREGARRISDSLQSYQTAACNVLNAEGFQGYLGIFEVQKPITDGEMLLLEEAAHMAAAAPYPLSENGFLRDHLEGRVAGGELTANWLSALRWRVDDGVYVVAVECPPERQDDKLLLDHMVRMLRLILPYSLSQQMGEMPVAVANSRLVARDRALADVETFLENLGVDARVGASEVMVGISDLQVGYAHAQFAARFAGRHQRTVMRFEQCRFAFFSDLCNLEANRTLVVDGRVARMFQDDLHAGTDNVATLRTYLETGLNVNETARTLSVHRNTVPYRLRHIAERYDLPVASPMPDPALLFHVLLSCKVVLGDS